MTIDGKLFRLNGGCDGNEEENDSIWNQVKLCQMARCQKSSKRNLEINKEGVSPNNDLVDVIRAKLEECQSFRLSDPKKYNVCIKDWEDTMLPQLGNFLDLTPYNVQAFHPYSKYHGFERGTESYTFFCAVTDKTIFDHNILNNDYSWMFYYSNQNKSMKIHCEDKLRKEIHMKNPLYSVGACEFLPTSFVTDDNKKKNQKDDTNVKMVITGRGSALIDAMEHWMNNCIFDKTMHETTPTNTIHLPTHYHVNTVQIFHSIMGRPFHSKEPTNGLPDDPTTSNDSNSKSTSFKVPSYLAICQMYFNQKLSDRQLPLVILCPTTTDSFNDTRSRYKFGHELKQWQLAILTSPNLTESRSIQDGYVQLMFIFYSHMLISSTLSKEQNDLNCNDLIRIRVIPPHELEWNEARRVVVEGYMPSIRQYVNLGSVSNKTDYITRSYQIQFIGGGGASSVSFNGKNKSKHRQYCFLIHIEFCSIDVALPWWLENNIIYHDSSNDTPMDTGTIFRKWGIGIPPCLNQYYNLCPHSSDSIHNRIISNKTEMTSIMFVPFQRIWKNGSKKGKIIFHEFHPKPLPYYITLFKTKKEKNKNSSTKSTRDDDIQSVCHSKNTIQDHLKILSDSKHSSNTENFTKSTLSAKDIEGEFICSSYSSFLPFLSSNS